MAPRIIALVPIRHHSERVPGKNYKPFAGRPLYHHIISSLLDCPLISQVVIDTDSPVILEDATKRFPDVTLIERPEHLRADTTPMNDVLLNDVSLVESEYYLQTHSTNPLLLSQTIGHSLQMFLDNYPMYDSLFGVTKLQTRIWNGLAQAVNHNPAILLRTQDLPPMYLENSCLYIFTRSTLEAKHNRIGDRPIMFEIDRVESTDIDEDLDFRVAEFLYKEREGLL
jgi:CMP-N-acetylneuraminic acid synthetase